MEESDHLLRRCQAGDDAALAELIRRYRERIFRLAFRMAGDAALAEEAAARALEKIWLKADQWRGQARAETWIYRMAVRTVLDVQRSQRRWWRRWARPVPIEQPDPRPTPYTGLEEREEQESLERKLRQALAELSEVDRVLIHLFYYEEQGLGEIAAILGVPRETLKMRLSRARGKLRLLLRPTDESTGTEL